MTSDWIRFGNEVRVARLARDWTLEEFARQAFANPDRRSYCSQIEQGKRKLSALTVKRIARALELADSVVHPLLGYQAPQTDETRSEDYTVEVLLSDVEELRSKIKLSEALTIALAYKYAEGAPTDVEGALKGLEAALELSVRHRALSKRSVNETDPACQIYSHIVELNERGEVDVAYKKLREEVALRKRAREQRAKQDILLLEFLAAQAILNHDYNGLATTYLELAEVIHTNSADCFEYIYECLAQHLKSAIKTGSYFELEAAEAIARVCVSVATTTQLRARAYNGLGCAITDKGERKGGTEGAALLHRACEKFNYALKMFARSTDLLLWAKIQHNMANTLTALARSSDDQSGLEFLRSAVLTFRDALTVFTEADHPEYWAETSQCLSIALKQYATLVSGEDKSNLLTEAIGSSRAALRFFNEGKHPLEWGRALHNLGLALKELGATTANEGGIAILNEAVEAFSSALRVRTKAKWPFLWAMTQEGLMMTFGNIAKNDATRDKKSCLETALSHADRAFDVYDADHHPERYRSLLISVESLQLELSRL